MWEHSATSSRVSGVTIKLSLVGGFFALIWGLILAVLRQLPGKVLCAGPLADDRYIDALRGIPLLLTILLIYGLATLAS